MSMTRDEAIKHLLHDWHINVGCDFAIKPGRLDGFLDALDVALSALRPITREQVWRGEWKCHGDCGVTECSACGWNIEEYVGNYNFCPVCGAPMTDKAVDMVMERLEEMRNG